MPPQMGSRLPSGICGLIRRHHGKNHITGPGQRRVRWQQIYTRLDRASADLFAQPRGICIDIERCKALHTRHAQALRNMKRRLAKSDEADR